MNHATLLDSQACSPDTRNRISVSLMCDVRQDGRPWIPVCLEDISPNGFRINLLPGYNPGKPLLVRIPGIQVLTAYVRWQDHGALGCKFSQPLHVAVFEHIVRWANFS